MGVGGGKRREKGKRRKRRKRKKKKGRSFIWKGAKFRHESSQIFPFEKVAFKNAIWGRGVRGCFNALYGMQERVYTLSFDTHGLYWFPCTLLRWRTLVGRV